MRIDIQLLTIKLLPQLLRVERVRDRRADGGFWCVVKRVLTNTDLKIWQKVR
jgi:hypothetical protein